MKNLRKWNKRDIKKKFKQCNQEATTKWGLQLSIQISASPRSASKSALKFVHLTKQENCALMWDLRQRSVSFQSTSVLAVVCASKGVRSRLSKLSISPRGSSLRSPIDMVPIASSCTDFQFLELARFLVSWVLTVLESRQPCVFWAVICDRTSENLPSHQSGKKSLNTSVAVNCSNSLPACLKITWRLLSRFNTSILSQNNQKSVLLL